ncbi:MAG: aminoacyltransferase [Candidatus Dojkabacteria bacterium]|nr:aminoacyltransferase [Candidatus Dojkabacteria bacterium]
MLKEIDIEEYKKKSSPKTFLQEYYWAQLKSLYGYQVRFFEYIPGDKYQSNFYFFCLIKYKFGFSVAYVPRVANIFTNKDQIQRFIDCIKNKFFVTLIEFDNLPDACMKYLDFSKKDIQPSTTFITPIDKDFDISSIKNKVARKNIRKSTENAEKFGWRFEVNKKLNDKDLNMFYKHYLNMTTLKGYNKREIEYFQRLQEIIDESIWYVLYDHENKLIMANYAILHEKTKTNYLLYVARDMNLDKYEISYFLMYQIFLYLRDIGYQYCDHWGYDLKDPRKYGYSKFKEQFGGIVKNYPKPIVVGKVDILSKFLSILT